MFARPLINAMEFAGNGREIRGEVPLNALSKLDGMLSDSAGALVYVVKGIRSNDRHVLEVYLSGAVYLRCQRCLGNLEYLVEVSSRLKIASTEELEAIDDEDEDEYIEDSSQLDVLGLVEDEFILSLPFAPRHSEGTCSPVGEVLKQSATPFAVLAGLKN